MKKLQSIGIRAVGLILVFGVGLAIFVPPLLAKREEMRVRTMLLTIQEGLQNFHVKEEIYPRTAMSGTELAQFLAKAEFLDSEITNPWTGESYLEESDEDWLRYRTGDLAETYELIVYRAGTEDVQFRLDSTENQSLE
jgi:hypothetical protein